MTTTNNDEKFECVFINDNGKAKLAVVETGIQDDTNIEVISGLSEGDEIIIGPYNLVSKSLKPGDLVEEKKKEVDSE
jgi:HlyD family secretion protein